jgi:hypothetical protein
MTKKIIKKPKKQVDKIEAKFSIEQIVMDKDLQWKAKMRVTKILPKSYHDYTIKMTLDEAPYDKRVATLELELKELGRGQQQLLKEMAEARKGQLNDDILEEKSRLEEMRDKCKAIEFLGEVKELKYKDGDTVILIRLADEVIEQLNKAKYLFSNYKISLIPVEFKEEKI